MDYLNWPCCDTHTHKRSALTYLLISFCCLWNASVLGWISKTETVITTSQFNRQNPTESENRKPRAPVFAMNRVVDDWWTQMPSVLKSGLTAMAPCWCCRAPETCYMLWNREKIFQALLWTPFVQEKYGSWWFPTKVASSKPVLLHNGTKPLVRRLHDVFIIRDILSATTANEMYGFALNTRG